MAIVVPICEPVAPHRGGAEISMLHCDVAIAVATRPAVPNRDKKAFTCGPPISLDNGLTLARR